MQKKEVSIAPGHGPGKTLGQARADLKLSQDEVALQLHLAPRQIVALEGDDYTNLPEPTYVRGYLRNYALLLGLDPEPILHAYAQLVPASKTPALQKVSRGVGDETTSKEPHVKLASYVVGALVIGLAIAWWQSDDPARTLPTAEIVAVAPSDEDPSLAPEAEEEATTPGALSEAMSQSQPAPISPLASGAPPALPAIPARPAPAAVPVAPAVAPPTAAVPAAPAPRTAVAASPAAVSTPTAAPVASSNRAQIVLRTEQDSWAEVRDGQDSRLLYENVPAGRTVKIEGEAPLSVFLGNVDGVKVEYNGRPYDATRHKRGMVARFTLGAPAPTPAADAPNP